MESHHQNMSRLIAEWRYQQEKGLTWKEWAEGILDGRPVEGAPGEGTDLNRQGLRCPESTIPGWYPPMPEDVLIPPVVSASSGLLEEGPEQTPDHNPNQGNQHLPSVQPYTPVSQTSMPEDRWTEEWQRAIQAVRDITTGQPSPTLEENQMYDWDGQFDETLGLPIQLRNRVSDPGTPLVRASPRTPGHGGGAGGATANIGSGPRLYTVTEDTRGNGTGEAEELPPQWGEGRTVPPTPQPRPQKTQAAEGKVGRMSPQEIRWQADFAQSGEDQAERPFLVLWMQALGENLWSLHHMDPPGQRMVWPQCLDFSTNTPIYLTPCQICGSLDHQTDYWRQTKGIGRSKFTLLQGRWGFKEKVPELYEWTSRGIAHADGVTNLDTFHPNVRPDMTARSWDRGFQRGLKGRNPPSAGTNAGSVPSTTSFESTVRTYHIHDLHRWPACGRMWLRCYSQETTAMHILRKSRTHAPRLQATTTSGMTRTPKEGNTLSREAKQGMRHWIRVIPSMGGRVSQVDTSYFGLWHPE